MPASIFLKAAGVLAAATIVSLAIPGAPVQPRADLYTATVELAAGALMIAGSFSAAHAISDTFLRCGGRAAFKALYIAALTAAGAGLSEAVSGFIAINIQIVLTLSLIFFLGTGLLLLKFSRDAGIW